MKQIEERFLDSLYSGIYGDILGSVYEFKNKSDIPQNLTVPMILQNKTNVFGNPVGTFTDDTILMLCAMGSFNEVGHFDHANQMKWIGKYIRDGLFSCTGKCFDIGHSTLDSYDEWENNVIDASSKNQRQGNGVLMRLAPYAYYCAKRNLNIADFSKQVTDLTHSTKCYASTEKMMSILVSYYMGQEQLFAQDANGDSVTGFHWGSLNTAIASIETDVETTILNAIMKGGDTDTNACIAAQIAGAMYGINFDPIVTLNLSTAHKVTIESFIQLLKP